MPPDFLLRCTGCGGEAVWDTEAVPPVGVPEIGHPVLWRCETCGGEQRHIVQCVFLIADKLYHEICVATEIDRRTVDCVMAELRRYRTRTRDGAAEEQPGSMDEFEDVAGTIGVSPKLVRQICQAEAAWMRRRGYVPEWYRGT